MAAKWEYHRFHDDSFLLVCRANCGPDQLDGHPSVQAFEEAVQGARENDRGTPEGPASDPRHWRGKFTLGSLQFRIPAIYAFNKFFGLVCDPISDGGRDDYHDAANMQRVVAALNAGIPD